MCRSLFAQDPTKSFLHSDAVPEDLAAELSLSLDAIYYLVEDPVFESYMNCLFGSAQRFVIIYSSNVDQEWPASHVRHREFTR